MFCIKCGKELPDGALFCTACGEKVLKSAGDRQERELAEKSADVSNTERHDYSFPQGAPTISAIDNEYNFTRTKGFSYFSYKEEKTTASISDGKLHLKKLVEWFYFIKRPVQERDILLNTIVSVDSKVSFALWDTLFAAMFIIAALSGAGNGWWILAILFLWCALGRKIVIETATGETVQIPCSFFSYNDSFITTLKAEINAAHIQPPIEEKGSDHEADAQHFETIRK